MRVLRFDPAGRPRATVLHFHGGGFRQGRPELSAAFAAALAARCGVRVICPAYRFAPEHPFPAALHDACAVARALDDPILSGDSAGGGIAAALGQLCPEARGLVLLSPWLDLTVTSACYADNAATDPLFSQASASEAAAQYLQGVPADAMLASPLFADPRAFPPTFVSAGDGEVLADDARSFHARLVAVGVEAQLLIVPGMEHAAVTRGLSLRGAAETFAAVAGFVDALL